MNTIKRIITSAVIAGIFMTANVHAWKRDNNAVTIESSQTSQSRKGKLTINCVGRGVVEMLFSSDEGVVVREPSVLMKFSNNEPISMKLDYFSFHEYGIPREYTGEIYQVVQEAQQVELEFVTSYNLSPSYLFDWSADYYKTELEQFVRRCSAKLRFN